MHKVFLAFLFLVVCSQALSQQFPTEGRVLNYRIIGFLVEPGKHETKYKIEIAQGNYTSVDSFKNHTIISQHGTGSQQVIEVPYFNTQYTWRLIGNGKNPESEYKLNHFSTGYMSNLDSAATRLRIVKKAEKFQDAFVFSDLNKILYNMDGKPVWYLPNINGIVDNNSVIRDLKVSCAGTITFLSNDKPFEIDYNGNVLWRAPRGGNRISGDSIEHFHHEFTRMKNGHYMILGNELIPLDWKNYQSEDSSAEGNADEKQKRKTPKPRHLIGSYGTIIEYDRQGTIVWHWKSSDYYKGVDFHNCKTKKPILDIHENAFYYDEERQAIYLSFKNIDQIVKLKYPEATIENILGTLYYINAPCPDTALFWEQHGIKVSKKGNLFVFNNNVNNLDTGPTVVMTEEPVGTKYYLKKIWEYQYPLAQTALKRLPLTNGGNVIEMPDESIFVSMCTPYGNVFIVNKSKYLYWDAILEKYNQTDRKWLPVSQYRASIINNQEDLETLIWHREPTQK